MSLETILILAILVFLSAALYASVGHAGASGYLAAMAIVGLAPEVMKPSALVLNILVASIATVKYYRAGRFSWPVFWPFALLSVPCAFVGGAVMLPAEWYRPVVGAVLLYAAYRLFRHTFSGTTVPVKPAHVWVALITGAGIGFLSGLTGVGGGIFLSPVLLLMGWSDARTMSGVSAAFILVNSIAGLSGHLTLMPSLPGFLPFLGVTAIIGGWIGAEIGSKRLASHTIRYILIVVLVIAATKMLVT